MRIKRRPIPGGATVKSPSEVRAGRGVIPWISHHRAPSADALEAGRNASNRAKQFAAVRYTFLDRDGTDRPHPPMARMLRGGRGGEVRLKLYLSLLWLARDGLPLTHPARAWASLLDLPDPVGKGTRRINDALDWLATQQMLELNKQPGKPSTVKMLSDSGNGTPWEYPGKTYNRLRNVDAADEHRYIQVPRELWTKGWICILSGAAVAMLLVLLRELGPDDPKRSELWFSPAVAQARYTLSEDTRSKGLSELRRAGLVSTQRRAVDPKSFDFQRVRNVYTLDLDWLKTDTKPARIAVYEEKQTT